MIPERKVGTYSWNTADMLAGRMFVGGPQWARSCPGCGSDEIERKGSLANPVIKCANCGTMFGGASARA